MISTEKNHKLTLSREQLRQLARYELTFDDLTEGIPIDAYEIDCPEPYKYTLEDLREALINIKAKDPTVGEFGDDWFYPVTELDDAFGLDQARGLLLEEDDTLEEWKDYPFLNLSDSRQFDSIWWELDICWEDCYDDDLLSDGIDLDELLENLDRYYSNKKKPLEEWIFTEFEMKAYMHQFESGKSVEKASDKELALCRRFVDELCAEGDVEALHLKGYACYGGNRLYECNWPESRDCMLTLFEKTDKPQYANTLGYIFYYGRCTGGVPEYDKAFYYFGISAANGLYEGMYKLADMYVHGYGCKKSAKTARSLYGMVYQDSLKHFLTGHHANFADAALRMGNVYAKGIGVEKNPLEAYLYYLEAAYAAKLRAKHSDFFGNNTVVLNTQKALEEIREDLPNDYFKDFLIHDEPYAFYNLIMDNNRCTLSRSDLEDGNVVLNARRIATKSCPKPDSILLTYGQIQFCKRVKEFTMTAVGTTELFFEDEADEVRFDYCTWNRQEKRFDFYYDDYIVAYIKCEGFRIEAEKKTVRTGNQYLFAGIRFQPGGRIYDYICDIEDVKVGDQVVVSGYDGDTEVEVVMMHSKYESELSLPMERFKKVIRKV